MEVGLRVVSKPAKMAPHNPPIMVPFNNNPICPQPKKSWNQFHTMTNGPTMSLPLPLPPQLQQPLQPFQGTIVLTIAINNNKWHHCYTPTHPHYTPISLSPLSFFCHQPSKTNLPVTNNNIPTIEQQPKLVKNYLSISSNVHTPFICTHLLSFFIPGTATITRCSPPYHPSHTVPSYKTTPLPLKTGPKCTSLD